MKAAFITLSLAAGFAAAVSISDLPACALTCAESSAADTTCSVEDTACLCDSATYATAFEACVEAGCDSADLETTLELAEELCDAATSTSAAAAATSTASVAAATSSVVVASTTAAAAAATSAVVATGTAALSTGSATAASNGSSVASSTPVPYTGGADALKAGQWLGFLALFGLVAL